MIEFCAGKQSDVSTNTLAVVYEPTGSLTLLKRVKELQL